MLFIVFVIGCEADVRDKKLTQDNLQSLDKDNDLSDEEKQLIISYVMRIGVKKVFSGIDSTIDMFDSNMTLRQAIEKQRQWLIDDSIRVAEEERLAKEALEKKEAEMALLRSAIIVSLLKKEYLELEHQGYNIITYSAINKSEKIVKGFKGMLVLQDMFGDPIINLEIKYEKAINPSSRIIEKGGYEYNKYIDSHGKLRYANIENIKAIWNPSVIVFADGTKYEID